MEENIGNKSKDKNENNQNHHIVISAPINLWMRGRK